MEHVGRHYCVLQSMKQVSSNKRTVVLKCKGCGVQVTVKRNSLVYASWKKLTGKVKEEEKDERE